MGPRPCRSSDRSETARDGSGHLRRCTPTPAKPEPEVGPILEGRAQARVFAETGDGVVLGSGVVAGAFGGLNFGLARGRGIRLEKARGARFWLLFG